MVVLRAPCDLLAALAQTYAVLNLSPSTCAYRPIPAHFPKIAIAPFMVAV